jgi:putative endonuclease
MSSSENTKKGKIGELLAEKFLLKKGYEIIAQNYRFARAEIDIIAQKDDLMVFTPKKIEMIQSAADNYIDSINWNKQVRYDVISILQMANKTEYYHIEDAF